MTSPVDIIINALWRGGGETAEAERDLRKLDTTAGRSASPSGGLGTLITKAGILAGALTGVAITAKKAYDELERAAGLELTEQRFDRLAESIGTTGDALRDDLGVATQGLLSNAEQMALATDIISLGLVNNADDAVRLAAVMSALGADINQVTLALTNQTTMRFDQIGIAVAGFEDRLAGLEAQGLDTQAAFTEAFLQQGEAQIERVGGVAGTTAGEFMRLEASIKDVRDEAGRAALNILEMGGAIDSLSGSASDLQIIAAAIGVIRRESEDLNINIFSDALAGATAGLTTELGLLIDLLGLTVRAYEALEPVQGEFASGQREGADATKDLYGELNILAIALEEITSRMAGQQQVAQGLISAYNALADTQKRLPAGPSPAAGFFTQVENQAERADLFEDFQEDLTSINEREASERAAIEEQYESQRTAIVENYNQQRAREEADWQLRRARQEEDLRRNISDVREDAAEAEAEAREQANDRLADLERDHLQRMQDIIDNADEQLRDAASNLDARAVARITRQRDKALEDEQESYQEQRAEIEENLQEQLESIRENMAERIEDLEEFHRERQEREEEDRRIRLQRMEEDHRRQLDELRQQEQRRLEQIRQAAAIERAEREQQYREERLQLDAHWRDRHDLESAWMTNILRLEEEFWRARLNLVGGGDADFDPENPPPTGGDGGGDNEPAPPNQAQLLNMATSLMADAGWPESVIFEELRRLRNLTNEAIADWIEETFGVDVPGYQLGTLFVPRSGPAMLHQGEAVLDVATASLFRRGVLSNSNMTIEAGAVVINAPAGTSATAIATAVDERLRQWYVELNT